MTLKPYTPNPKPQTPNPKPYASNPEPQRTLLQLVEKLEATKPGAGLVDPITVRLLARKPGLQGCWMQDSGFRVQGLGFTVQGSGFRV